jgi:uncharacterized membrane protein
MAQTRKPSKQTLPKPVELPEDELLEDEAEADLTTGGGRVFDIALIVLSVIGIGISSYLTYTHFAHANIACFDGTSCDTVNQSKYAYLFGIPVALLGLLFYLVLLAGLVTRAVFGNRENFLPWRGRLDLGIFVAALGGLAFTAYLQAMEVFEIRAICIWCVSSAITLTTIFVLLTVRLLRA